MHARGTLTARRVTKHYGAKTVLEDASLVVPPRARLGVVGPNGSGKSTLLRLLAGLEEPDAGSIERSPRTLTVGYLPQEPDAAPDEPVLAYLARRTGIAAVERRLEAGQAEALDEFLALGGDDFLARARRLAFELDISPERLALPAGALSGGQRARVALAAILLSRFDVLLLDEPTNDLDFNGLALLERFLAATQSALVVVSHDRELLDRVATSIVELEDGEAGVREWAGGWSEYAEARDRALRRQYEEYEHVQLRRKELTRLLSTR